MRPPWRKSEPIPEWLVLLVMALTPLALVAVGWLVAVLYAAR